TVEILDQELLDEDSIEEEEESVAPTPRAPSPPPPVPQPPPVASPVLPPQPPTRPPPRPLTLPGMSRSPPAAGDAASDDSAAPSHPQLPTLDETIAAARLCAQQRATDGGRSLSAIYEAELVALGPQSRARQAVYAHEI